MNVFLALLSGLLLALSFPKFGLSFLIWFALVPLFVAIERAKSAYLAAFYSFICALVFFSLTLFWVNTLIEYGGPLVILGWIGLVLLQGAYFMLFGFLTRALRWQGNIFMGLLYVFVEWLRELGIFGISAGGLGYTQIEFLPLIQIASFTTVLGVSFIIVLSNICLSGLITGNKALKYNLIIFLVLTIASLSYGSYSLSLQRAPKRSLKLALIQPNIPQKWKLDPRYNQQVFSIHEELSAEVLKDKPDIIIWPETMVLSYVMSDLPFRTRAENLAKNAQAYLLFGTPFMEKGRIYNSLIALSPEGKVLGRYDKRYLVPFGEYLPLRPLTYPLLRMTGFFAQDINSNPDPRSLNLNGLKIGPAICFESSFIRPLNEQTNKGADILLTVSNDAWFKDSAALDQHINCGVMRAIENRRYFIQVANTGISAVIDPYGRFLLKTKANTRKALTLEIALP